MRAVLKFMIFRAVVPLSLLALFFSFLGGIHPIGDSLAVFRQFFVCLILAEAIWRLRGFWRWLGIIPLVVVVLVFLLQPFLVPDENEAMPEKTADYRLYQKNLRYDNNQTEVLARDILESEADFVTFQEVFHLNESLLDRLTDAFPAQHVCEFAGVGSVGVLSRYEASATTSVCAEFQGLAALEVITPDGPLWIGTVHFHWPWPFQQAKQLKRILPFVEALEGPVVIGGDANMVPTSDAIYRLEQASRTKVVSNNAPTYFASGFWGLRIDQVFTPNGRATLYRRPFLGSDHLGLIADFSLENN